MFRVTTTLMRRREQNVVYLALGSNLGDRARHLLSAITALRSRVGQVEQTSCLYQTSPQYVENQPQFLNAACRVVTRLSPEELLSTIKKIEVELGRKPNIRYGPRVVDLDILFYNDDVIDCNTPEGPLKVPHALIPERDFVLRPLCDLDQELRHPVLKEPIIELYRRLQTQKPATYPLPQRVVSFGSTVWTLGAKTYVVGVINVTPDSFSDGGAYITTERAARMALQMEKLGCDMIDLGGESSRPGAIEVSEEEEINRVVPTIRAIRTSSSIPISVDTTKAAVARAAIEAGANVINDISAGQHDEKMFGLVRELGIPIILMHMRGNARTMKAMKDYQNVVEDVLREVNERVREATLSGIPRWQILTDPGIGFSKGKPENLELLRNMRRFVEGSEGSGVMVGSSRKKFIGTICGKDDPKDRTMGTAATCAAAIAGGCDLIRVHDVGEMIDVAKMSDAIWRNS